VLLWYMRVTLIGASSDPLLQPPGVVAHPCAMTDMMSTWWDTDIIKIMDKDFTRDGNNTDWIAGHAYVWATVLGSTKDKDDRI
jgi:hypothetical protein